MKLKFTAIAFATLMAMPVYAQDLIGAYVAYIGKEDLYNSKGARLSQAWQVLRQDRANFHKFNRSQPGDEWDPFFNDIGNRAAMERMLMNGVIDNYASRRIVNGDVSVVVRIFGYDGRGDYVTVTVVR